MRLTNKDKNQWSKNTTVTLMWQLHNIRISHWHSKFYNSSCRVGFYGACLERPRPPANTPTTQLSLKTRPTAGSQLWSVSKVNVTFWDPLGMSFPLGRCFCRNSWHFSPPHGVSRPQTSSVYSGTSKIWEQKAMGTSFTPTITQIYCLLFISNAHFGGLKEYLCNCQWLFKVSSFLNECLVSLY